ncbi:MAG: LPS assembly protein LptD [Candidatus Brocadiia bacterium]
MRRTNPRDGSLTLNLVGGVWLLCFLLAAPRFGLAGQHAKVQIPFVQKGMPIIVRDNGDVLSWDTPDLKVLILTKGGEFRQGTTRFSGSGIVVWLHKREVVQAATPITRVEVYVEGAGEPGSEASKPACLIGDGEVQSASAFYLSVRTNVGLAWAAEKKAIEKPETIALYRRAAKARALGSDAVALEKIPRVETPGKAPVEWPVKAVEQHVFYDEEKGTITGVFLGDVRVSYGNVVIRADSSVVWKREDKSDFEIYASGNVLLRRKEKKPGADSGEDELGLGQFETFRADEMYINTGQEKALAEGVELRLVPEGAKNEHDIFVGRGRQVYVMDSQNLLIKEGGFTTCPFAHPHYQVIAEKLRVLHPGSSVVVSAWNTDLVVGENETRLFGLPYTAQDLTRDEGYLLSSVSLGTSSQFGSYVRTKWRPSHAGVGGEWIEDWILEADYFGDRGPAGGSQLEYGSENQELSHTGNMNMFWVHDRADEDSSGEPIEKPHRGRFYWQHRTKWSKKWRTDFEFHYLSDSGFLEEYFEYEFDHKKPPESYIFTRYADGHLWAGLTAKKRVNHFLTQLEELPSLELEWIGVPIAGMLYDAVVELGNYKLAVSDELAIPEPPDVNRAHTEHMVSLPFRIGILKVDPFLRVLATWADKGALENGSWSGTVGRVGGGGGIGLSTQFHRSMNVKNKFLGINRLRHILQPFVEAEALESSEDSAEFIQLGGYDPWPRRGHGPRVREDTIDAIDDNAIVRVGFRQRLQTKRSAAGAEIPRIVDWLELDVAYVDRSSDSVRVGNDDDYLTADMDWRIHPNLTLFSHDNRISLDDDGIDVVNAGSKLDLSPAASFSVEYDRVENLSSSLAATLRAKLSDRYRMRVSERYEFDVDGSGDDDNMETKVVIQRIFHKWVLDLGYRFDEADDESEFLLGFSLTGGGFDHLTGGSR